MRGRREPSTSAAGSLSRGAGSPPGDIGCERELRGRWASGLGAGVNRGAVPKDSAAGTGTESVAMSLNLSRPSTKIVKAVELLGKVKGRSSDGVGV